MTRAELIARMAANTDDEIVDLLETLTDTSVDVVCRSEKIALCAAEIDTRPFASMLLPEAGESSSNPVAVAWAIARWAMWAPVLVDGNIWIDHRKAGTT